jgi:hypothetical protein
MPTKPRPRIVTPTEADRERARWRIDLDGFLEAAQVANRQGAGEAALKGRLEAVIRALDHRLEQRRLAR